MFSYEFDGIPVITTQFDSAATGANPAKLVTTNLPFVRGIHGGVEGESRMDRCPRCGLWMLRERFVEDGYAKGLLVCDDCWDPEDPPSSPIPPDRPPIND